MVLSWVVDWYIYPVVVGAGFLAGFINILAGSGSLITLPMLIILVGLPVPIANGTNRIAVLLQNVVGIKAYSKKGVLDVRGVLIFGIPAILGSVIGAQIAVNLDEEILRKSIGVVMVLMLGVILFRPRQWLHGELQHMTEFPSTFNMLIFFIIGIYGGFIQAGVGIFLLAALVLGIGYDLVRANAIKVGIVLVFTLAALTVFVINDQVDWSIGLVLAIGNMAGAWTATNFAVEMGTVWVRRVLIAVVIFSAVSLLDLVALFG